MSQEPDVQHLRQINALFEHELNEFKSAQVTRVVHDWYDSDPKRGFYGGGGIDSRIGPMRLHGRCSRRRRAAPGAPDSRRCWSPAARDDRRGSRHVAAARDNRIDLDPELKDAWACPRCA